MTDACEAIGILERTSCDLKFGNFSDDSSLSFVRASNTHSTDTTMVATQMRLHLPRQYCAAANVFLKLLLYEKYTELLWNSSGILSGTTTAFISQYLLLISTRRAKLKSTLLLQT